MADRIPTYQERIGVNDAGQQRVVLPDFRDTGDEISRVGQSLLREAAPHVQQHVERQAMEDVGNTELVKDADGNFTYPEMPMGSGMNYANVYRAAMDRRYAGVTQKSFETQLDTLGAEHRWDPEGFTAKATGWAEGMLKGAPAHLRADLDTGFAREIGERFRGISDRTAVRDHQLATQGQELTIQDALDEATSIASEAQTDVDFTRAQLSIDRAKAGYDELVKLGEYSPEGAAAASAMALRKYGNAEELGLSLVHLKGMGALLSNGSTEELKNLWRWTQGIDAPGKVGAIDGLAKLRDYIPSEAVRDKIAALTMRTIGERDQAARDQLAAERAEQAHTDSQAVTNEIQLGRGPAGYNYQGKAKSGLELDYERSGGARDLNTEKGMARTLGYVEKFGYLPDPAKDWVEARIMSRDYAGAMTFMTNLRRTETTDGTMRGEDLFQQLTPRSRALYELDKQLRIAGVTDTNARLSTAMDKFKGQAPTMQEISGRYTGARREDRYLSKRDATIAGIVGTKANAVPFQLQRAVDAVMPSMTMLFPDDPEQAMKMAVQSAAGGWKRDARFMGGVAPVKFATRGYTNEMLDRFVSPAPMNGTRAKFAAAPGQPFLRLAPPDDDPTQGFGKFRVLSFTGEGRPTGGWYVDMDVVGQKMDSELHDARQKRGQAAIAATRVRRQTAATRDEQVARDIQAEARARFSRTPAQPTAEWGK